MDIDKRLSAVVKDIRSGSDTDHEWTAKEAVKKAIRKFDLNREEIKYLCRRFHILTEDLED